MIETLIVEDNPALRKALVAGLEATGEYSGHVLSSGEQARRRPSRRSEKRPQCAWRMPPSGRNRGGIVAPKLGA